MSKEPAYTPEQIADAISAAEMEYCTKFGNPLTANWYTGTAEKYLALLRKTIDSGKPLPPRSADLPKGVIYM